MICQKSFRFLAIWNMNAEDCVKIGDKMQVSVQVLASLCDRQPVCAGAVYTCMCVCRCALENQVDVWVGRDQHGERIWLLSRSHQTGGEGGGEEEEEGNVIWEWSRILKTTPPPAVWSKLRTRLKEVNQIRMIKMINTRSHRWILYHERTLFLFLLLNCSTQTHNFPSTRGRSTAPLSSQHQHPLFTTRTLISMQTPEHCGLSACFTSLENKGEKRQVGVLLGFLRIFIFTDLV